MPITVLIVDDSKLARIVVARTLKALQPDWERAEASNADQALSIFEAERIDLALLDYNLPGRNGLELAAELRIRSPEMPIAIITADVQPDVISGAQRVNSLVVNKPLTEDGLRPFLSVAAARLGESPV
jgi:CheY-like chemotaxis protein